MFIMPAGNRVDWKRPPIVSLMLILINCFVFFFLQAGDDQQDDKAIAFYYTTDLPNVEIPRYQSYLDLNGSLAEVDAFKSSVPKKDWLAVILMENNKKFMLELRAGRIVTTEMPEFTKWRELRKQYEARKSFTSRYLYRTGESGWVNIFTSAFMHGDFDHLFGNMVVLFLVGFLVESVVGKRVFLLSYLASAWAAIFMYSLTGQGNLLGASGAIAGVMGMYTVVYGFKKIDFFYSLGFYFDYVRAPAIALLPVWLGNEVYQHFSNNRSRVAYMAHFGGLVCGALLGLVYRMLRSNAIKDSHAAVDDKELEKAEFHKGMDYLGALDFKRALVIFKRIQAKHPQDTQLLRLIYRAAKAEPDSDDYHRAAQELLALSVGGDFQKEQLNSLFHEYMACAKPYPMFNQELLINLAKRFTCSGYTNDAEKLMKWLQSIAPQHIDLPTLMLLCVFHGILPPSPRTFCHLFHEHSA